DSPLRLEPCLDRCRDKGRTAGRVVWRPARAPPGSRYLDGPPCGRKLVRAGSGRRRHPARWPETLPVLEPGFVPAERGTAALVLQSRPQSLDLVGNAHDFRRQRQNMVETETIARRPDRPGSQQTGPTARRLAALRGEH